MLKIPPVNSFFTAAIADPRVTAKHISLYMALRYWSATHEDEHPIYVFSRDIMPIAKYSSVSTYHRLIRELHEFGYIRYIASHSAFLGSLVEFREIRNGG